MAVDNATGELFTVGNFRNTITLGAFTLTSTGGQDVYVAKYDGSGTCVKAIKLGSASDDIAYGITYEGITSLSPFVAWANGDFLTGGGMITKLSNVSSSLTVLNSMNLTHDVIPRAISSGYGKVYFAGSFINGTNFPKTSGGNIVLTPSNWGSGSFYDSFVATYNTSVNLIDAAINPNYSTDNNEINAIFIRNHRVYCTGYFQQDLKWALGSVTETASGERDLFVASVAINTGSKEIYVYATDLLRAGSAETGTNLSVRDCGNAITVNGTAIYIAGNLSNLGSAGYTFRSTNFNDGAGGFVARIDFGLSNSVGNANWVHAGYGPAATYAPVANGINYGIAVDGNGDVFATGSAHKDRNLKNGASYFQVGSNGLPGIVMKYSPAGSLISSDAINQSAALTTVTEGRAIAVNGCSVHVTGFTRDNNGGKFSFGNANPVSTSTNSAMFLVTMNRDATISNNFTSCVTCSSGFPISTSFTATGGTSYSWNPASNFFMAGCGSQDLTYTVDIAGACPVRAAIRVKAGSAVGTTNAGPDRTVCPSDVIALGGTAVAGLTYQWSPATYLSAGHTTLPNPTFNAPASGTLSITYTVVITDVCGGSVTDFVTVTWDPFCPHLRLGQGSSEAEPAVNSIYPNPSTGIFNLGLPASETESRVTVEVADLAGRIVQQDIIATTGGVIPIDLSSQPAGIYMLTVTREGVTEKYKLIRE
jgi:hypothetical protein